MRVLRAGAGKMRREAGGRPAEYRPPGDGAPVEIPAVTLSAPMVSRREREGRGGFFVGPAESLVARWSKETGVEPRERGTLRRDGLTFRITAVRRDSGSDEWVVRVVAV